MLKPPAQKYKKRELLASSHPPTMKWLHSKTFCSLSVSSHPLFNPVFSLFLPPLVWGFGRGLTAASSTSLGLIIV
ncbi:hypothetical protein DL95DRAFT_381959 [Leptodontidium sp. 2 PMI_412]|nr:hypothetical protein DL95DRAFT_381959 [Leptodontidium sp. 2 PMI_412]